MHEWALLIMTVCVPAAVGGFLFLGLFHSKIAKAGEDTYKAMKLTNLVFGHFINRWIVRLFLPPWITNQCILYDIRLWPFMDEQ